MSTPDHNIDQRLLESAKRHFLAEGFSGAQLRRICEDAGITTGALYKRHAGKEGLFEALVADTLRDIRAQVELRRRQDPASQSDEALTEPWTTPYAGAIEWFRFCFARYDGFALLTRCAEGTRHANFRHDFCAEMTDVDYLWLVELQRRGLCRPDVDKRELHVLLTAYWEAYYEPFVHGFTWEEIERHAQIMCRLFDWKSALGLGP